MDEIININGYTKSPWTLERDGDDYDSILELRGDSGSKPIACLYDSFFSDEHELTPEEVEADGLEYKRNIVLIQHAPELLQLAVGFSDACDDRIDSLNESDACDCSHNTERGVVNEDWEYIDENVQHGRHCDIGAQVNHWKAYKKEIDDVIAKTTL
jgi:hypothetical protein